MPVVLAPMDTSQKAEEVAFVSHRLDIQVYDNRASKYTVFVRFSTVQGSRGSAVSAHPSDHSHYLSSLFHRILSVVFETLP